MLSLIIMAMFMIVMLPFYNTVAKELRVAQTRTDREEALQIADAGINYYQWHLAHFPTDYQDGTGKAGPYVHTYTDLDTQKQLGQYSLVITPPATGSTIVTIQSTGSTLDNPSAKRTITARYGIPSLAIDSFLSNDVDLDRQ